MDHQLRFIQFQLKSFWWIIEYDEIIFCWKIHGIPGSMRRHWCARLVLLYDSTFLRDSATTQNGYICNIICIVYEIAWYLYQNMCSIYPLALSKTGLLQYTSRYTTPCVERQHCQSFFQSYEKRPKQTE